MSLGTVWAQWAKKRTFQAHAPVCFLANLHQRNLHTFQQLGSIMRREGTGSDGWNRTTDLGVMKDYRA